MEESLAKKLYPSVETIKPLNGEIGDVSTCISHQSDSYECDDSDLWGEDESLCDGSDNGLNKASELDREWQRRHNEFHTIGYRDGLMAGKETSAQEGFNIGFKQSVLVGYNWGIVRGITSVLACLPDGLKQKLVETLEKREKLQSLYESVHSISSIGALKLFHEDILASSSGDGVANLGGNSHEETTPEKPLSPCQLGRYFGELESLLHESPAIQVQMAADLKNVG
ncbi:PREDICTED: uncharacterized protein LOC104588807 [Nelumbo nucifera]|uniref:Uncharacterized protein LOC104588807 n=2 Tax=Nelumbo nucifera TaxID=4432 RepID=A0A1U7YXK6_NELNU|nr:PREDICTED: uncharacterized protein LOC104588807 [Nelumbo nucifera]XP_010245304.1 PREDICTED: uncharacterized protein LOC104588807 [Nelumbo nucifera]XP_010245370.1 PREDICTED: uncharacterized protein LOC104588807 [Nelumbo nucifera]XP_010245445.1 PREDICTED: uncharacterized protein LOC104588807 [Nelumbo nucifera]DAD35874.1 TPA_asm: hypothetical protein HUJ06_006514 [Nelumbo nucifera]